MRSLLLLLAFFSLHALSAQFGLTAFANFNDGRSEFADPVEQSVEGFDPGYEIAAHYWFRLPTKRVEFQPTVYYANAEREASGLRLKEYGVQLKTNFYLFDFGTDCNCPTFGKQGPDLQKGFFVQVAPGYAFYQDEQPILPGGEDATASGFTLAGALGIDFGLSNLLTVTPIAGVRYGFGDYTDIQFTDIDGNPTGTAGARLLTYQVGLQATFRLDKRRY